MNAIGFKTGAAQETAIATTHEVLESFEAAAYLKSAGYQKAFEILREYMGDEYIFMSDDNRDKKYMKKLRKVKERFFDKI